MVNHNTLIMELAKHIKKMLIYALLIVSGAGHLLACGIGWGTPSTHFDGVNEHGYVSYWDKIDDLIVDETVQLPLIISFKSSREGSSPYLGKGWMLMLLESNIVQIGDNSFLMTQPDGWDNYLIRGNASDTLLNGSSGWKAQVNNDTVTAWAQCGWKLEYYKGRIVSMTTPNNIKLEYVYSGNTVTEVRRNGKAILTVLQDDAGKANALLYNGKRVQISLGQKPKVEELAGEKVVGGIDQSLCTMNPTKGSSKSFEFSVNSKIQPTLKITSINGVERTITWDPATKWIISDDDWSYKITRHSDVENVALERSNKRGLREYWFQDAANGVETTITSDGIKTIKERFTSGIARGHMRSVRSYNLTGTLLNETVNSYNEQGKLLRITENSAVREIRHYDESGKLSWIWRTSEFVQYFYKPTAEWKNAVARIPKEDRDRIEPTAEVVQIHNGDRGVSYAFAQLSGKLLADISGTKLHLYHQQSVAGILKTITKNLN